MVKLTRSMKPIVYGTDHKFDISSKNLITASFGNTPRELPKGGKGATHFNADPALHNMTHDKARLLNKMGDLALPHLPIADLRSQHGFAYPVLEDVFPNGARFRHDGGFQDIGNVAEFQEFLEGWEENESGTIDKHGTFTEQIAGRQIIVCPGLMKDRKGDGMKQGLLAVDGGEVTEEELDFLTGLMTKFALEYYVVEAAFTKKGVKLADLHTKLIPAAFDIVGKAIKRKANI